VFSLVAMLKFLLSFSIDQSFKHLSKLVRDTGTLENFKLAVNLKKKILQNYGAAAIFFLYVNKNVPSSENFEGVALSENQNFYFFWPKLYYKDFFLHILGFFFSGWHVLRSCGLSFNE
jgi:hypothetical protein